MSDLISRKALCEYALNQKDKSITPNDIMRFPSAQAEERTEKRTETHGVCLDAIDRQATIDALEKVAELFPWRVPGNRDSYDYYNEAWNDAIGRAEIEIEKLPSAQPEVLACGEGELIAQPETDVLPDGTLMIDVPDLDKVNRVLVGNGRWCKVFYMDDSERRTDET